MAFKDYKPREGGSTEAVLKRLHRMGPGGEMTRLDVAELLCIPIRRVGSTMKWSLTVGLVEKCVGVIDVIAYRLPASAFDADAVPDEEADVEMPVQRIVPAHLAPSLATAGFASIFHLASGQRCWPGRESVTATPAHLAGSL